MTPIILARGDEGIKTPVGATQPVTIQGGRNFQGAGAWYSDGYFYLMTRTLQSVAGGVCPGISTQNSLALILLRVKADLSGGGSGNGLWLDAFGRPDVELYYAGGDENWHALPYPDAPISFSDDSYGWSSTFNGGVCGSATRQQVHVQTAASYQNPPVSGAITAILWPDPVCGPNPTCSGAFYEAIPTSTFIGYNGCDRYVVFADSDQVRFMKLTDTTGFCGAGNPRFQFSEVARLDTTLPPGYTVNFDAYGAIMPTFQLFRDQSGNVVPGTVIGFRHAVDTALNGDEGQFPMTASLPFP